MAATSASAAVAAALQPFADRRVLAGAVALVADRTAVRSLTAVGSADLATGRPMQSDTLFWIASQTKSITATAVMMLVDAGLLELDDPVAKYLPEFAEQWLTVVQDATHLLLRRPGRPITLRDVLSHTSGLPFKSALEEPFRDLIPLDVTVRSYAMTALQSEPGTRYQYSNAGINTAGRVLEVVSGLSYETFLRTRLLDPLGMADTTFRPDAAQLDRLAQAYKPNAANDGLEPAVLSQYTHPFSDSRRQAVPGGGLFSTAGNVARFCQMILNRGILDGRRYVSEAAIGEMTRKQTAATVPESYGLGWSVSETTCGHGGAWSTNMTIDWARGLTYVFLVQHAGFPGDGAQCQGAFTAAAERT